MVLPAWQVSWLNSLVVSVSLFETGHVQPSFILFFRPQSVEFPASVFPYSGMLRAVLSGIKPLSEIPTVIGLLLLLVSPPSDSYLCFPLWFAN